MKFMKFVTNPPPQHIAGTPNQHNTEQCFYFMEAHPKNIRFQKRAADKFAVTKSWLNFNKESIFKYYILILLFLGK